MNDPSNAAPDRGADAQTSRASHLAGDRGIPSVNRVRSMQSRVSSALALGVVALLGGGILAYYYSGAMLRQSKSASKSRSALTQKAQGDLPLPPLGVARTRAPVAPVSANSLPAASSTVAVKAAAADQLTSSSDDSGRSAVAAAGLEALLGPPPDLPAPLSEGSRRGVPVSLDRTRTSATPREGRGGVREGTRARQLSGPASVALDGSRHEVSSASGESEEGLGRAPLSATDARSGESGSALSTLLRSSTVQTISAQRLPNQRLLLTKGTFIDCSLETAVDTALPGFVTCIAASDVFGSDGSVVLLERGSKLFGETRSVSGSTGARVFVLWTEARSPKGIVARLDSPVTDALGRSGLTGDVDRHFWERFGAGMLVSVIDGGIRAVTQARSGTVVLNPQSADQPLTETLRGAAAIPATVSVAPGAHIQVLVARDVNFASVYGSSTDDPR